MRFKEQEYDYKKDSKAYSLDWASVSDVRKERSGAWFVWRRGLKVPSLSLGLVYV